MLYVYHGTDFQQVISQARGIIDGLLKKRPDASFVILESDSLREGLEELIEAQGLFNKRHITLLRAPFETAEARELMFSYLPRLKESDNIFVVATPTLDAATKKKVEAAAERIEEYASKVRHTEQFNVFLLGDLLGKRDKKALWMYYQDALAHGHAPEELHSTFFWAVKSMLLAASSASAEVAGQKPYVYTKFKHYAGNFTPEELQTLSLELVRMYHEARLGNADIPTALERWTLSI